mgnify:CR=1 FL=1
MVGRKSNDSLFDAAMATMEDDAGAYDQQDAAGFIKLNALRMRINANKNKQPTKKPIKTYDLQITA